MLSKQCVVQGFVIVAIILIESSAYRYVNPNACRRTLTTVSGTRAPTGRLCRGQLILEDNFNELDTDLWGHEVTLGGGGVSDIFKPSVLFFFF